MPDKMVYVRGFRSTAFELRNATGWSLRALATRLDVPLGTLQNWLYAAKEWEVYINGNRAKVLRMHAYGARRLAALYYRELRKNANIVISEC